VPISDRKFREANFNSRSTASSRNSNVIDQGVAIRLPSVVKRLGMYEKRVDWHDRILVQKNASVLEQKVPVDPSQLYRKMIR
jgi:hypothetical protein